MECSAIAWHPRALYDQFLEYMVAPARVRDDQAHTQAAVENRIRDVLIQLARVFRRYRHTNADYNLPMPENFEFDQNEEINRAFFPQNFEGLDGRAPLPENEQIAVANERFESLNPGQKDCIRT